MSLSRPERMYRETTSPLPTTLLVRSAACMTSRTTISQMAVWSMPSTAMDLKFPEITILGIQGRGQYRARALRSRPQFCCWAPDCWARLDRCGAGSHTNRQFLICYQKGSGASSLFPMCFSAKRWLYLLQTLKSSTNLRGLKAWQPQGLLVERQCVFAAGFRAQRGDQS